MTDTYTAAKPMAADVCLFLRGLPRQQRIDDGGYSPPVDGTRDPTESIERRTAALRLLYEAFPVPMPSGSRREDLRAQEAWLLRLDTIATWATQADDGQDDTSIVDPTAARVLKRWTALAREHGLIPPPKTADEEGEPIRTEKVSHGACYDLANDEAIADFRSTREEAKRLLGTWKGCAIFVEADTPPDVEAEIMQGLRKHGDKQAAPGGG